MSVDTFSKFYEKWIKIIPKNVECQIVWHGGEPTLRGLNFYREVFRVCDGLDTEGKKVVHCMQTNGISITTQWAELFARYKVDVGVSIDGPKDIHDKLRKTKSGGGTFDHAMRGFRILQDYGVTGGIVVVINKYNVACPDRIFQFMKENRVHKIQLSPCLEMGRRDAGFSLEPYMFGEFVCKLYDMWIAEDNPDLSIGFMSDIINHLIGKPHYTCALNDTCRNFMVLDPMGKIMTCDGMGKHRKEMGLVGKIDIDDPCFQKDWKALHDGISEMRRSECGQCEWYDLCHGGCPHHWGGEGSNKTAFCVSNKMIFEHVSRSIEHIYNN
jgi:uncharacterized protein